MKVLVCVAVLLGCGCSRGPEPKQYQLIGQIVAMAPERREVTIKHQDIPSFMPGMTMPFTVEDAALLDGKQAGDLVTATLVVGENSAHLSTLTRTGHQPVDAPPPSSGLRTGDQVADAPLVDQNGAKKPIASFRGHRVALTFIYTRCPIPDFCPLMTRHFATLQKALRSRPDLADVRLVSVTLDPAFDTPAVLKAHSGVFDADPAVWSFLTGSPPGVRAFAEQFGVYIESQPADPAQITHSLRTAVIGIDGRLVANHSGNDWTPDGLLADITKAAAPRN